MKNTTPGKVPPRDRVIEAARQLFAARGFHQTSMAELAETADVGVGTIYRSFPSKAEIIRAIIHDDMADVREMLQATIACVEQSQQPIANVMKRMFTDWLAKKSDGLGHEIVAEGHRNPEIAAVISAATGMVRDQFRELARMIQPDLPANEVEGVAELFLVCFFGMGNHKFTPPALDEDETASVMTQLILRAMRIEA